MSSALERQSLRRVVTELQDAGVKLPPEVQRNVMAVCGGRVSAGARLWALAHPDEDPTERVPCCSDAVYDPLECTCWTPVYDVEQEQPRPPSGAEDLQVRAGMCVDCAFRPGSPERSNPLMADDLMALPNRKHPFWCHDGIRRPVRWEHPDGRAVTADPDDYDPPVVGRVPFRADGSPALLCAGWAALATRTASEEVS